MTLTTWGENFIEQGIPEEEFADGFAARFDRFLVVIGDLQATNGDESFSSGETQLVDLVAPGPHALGTYSLSPGHWSGVRFSISPPSDDTLLHPSADDAGRGTMEAGGYSVYAEGRASRGDESWEFRWGFTRHTIYEDCVRIVDGRERPGFSVGAGSTASVELTLHGDHFFYDDLAADDASLRFEALAGADADDDGEVTLEELSQVPLIDLPAGTYGTGNLSDVDDLRAYIEALVANLGHFNGEGHCQPR